MALARERKAWPGLKPAKNTTHETERPTRRNDPRIGACDFPQRIGATVDFYGVHPLIKPTVSRLSGPVLAHFGLRDNTIPPDAANALVQRIRDGGKQVEAHFYDTGHAFFNDDRSQAYDAAAAQLAWERTITFLRAALHA